MLLKLLFIVVINLLNVESLLVNPRKSCIPTQAVNGPCHTCICNEEGVFQCKYTKCEDKVPKVHGSKSLKGECQPLMTYQYEDLICSCTFEGKWMSYNCRDTFRSLKFNKTTSPNLNLRSGITCTPNSLFLIDCIICRCENSGRIQSTSCTNRQCIKGHKADVCKFGDFLRTNDEICVCSDINYYIDRLCVKIEDKLVQEIKRDTIKNITVINPSRRSLQRDCIPYKEYFIDCNHCICDNNSRLVCTHNNCEYPKKALIGRGTDEFHNLPTVKSENDSCESGKKYRYKCNTCICTDNFLSCTTMLCLEDFVFEKKSLSSNLHVSDKPEIPQISEGQSCIAGKIYKLACNTCQCAPNNALLCTKMACLEKTIAKKIQNLKKSNSKPEPKRRNDAKKVLKKVKTFPKIPKGQCVPGRFYSKGCKKCLCNENKVIVCTETCSLSVTNRINDQDISQLESRSAQDLPELTHVGKECVPGKAYIVSCNLCICNEKGGLICTLKYCLHINSFAKLQVLKLTGTSCKEDYTDICVECKCVESKSQCSPAKMCDINNVSEKQLLSSVGKKIKLTLDVKKEKCIPNAIYKVHCNDCYCQQDGTLRCTQKVCLTYTQIKDLDARQTYLQKHGL